MIISKSILVLCISILVTSCLVIILRPMAKKIGLVDKPSKRKTHSGNVPLIGGVCIFVGFFLSIFFEIKDDNVLIAILVGSFFILILGFIDDCFPLPPLIKIVIQFVIVSLMVWYTGLKFDTFGHSFGLSKQISLGFFSYPFTILGIIFVANAFNLMDGADGVAGSLTIIAILGINLTELIFSDFRIDIITIALAGSLISFIWFNLQKSSKKIFLGDSGSLFLGYIIACLLLYQTKSNNSISPTIAFWIISIPIFDVMAVIVYRLKIMQPLFIADRSHLHHYLLRFGFKRYSVLFFIITLGILFLFLGIIIEYNTQFLSFPSFLLLLIFYIWIRVFSKL